MSFGYAVALTRASLMPLSAAHARARPILRARATRRRAVGATPAHSSTSVARSPSSGRSALRSILRRCANPPRTSAKNSGSDGTDTGGVARRRSRTRIDSTLGRGTNTVGGTDPSSEASA